MALVLFHLESYREQVPGTTVAETSNTRRRSYQLSVSTIAIRQR